MTDTMTSEDLVAARDLARRIASDGQWHVSESFQSIVRDDRRQLVCATDGDLLSGRDFERDAEDIVAARRLVPVLLAEVDRIQATLDQARSAVVSYRNAYVAYQDWASSRSGRLGSVASSDAAYREVIDGAIETPEIDDDPTYDLLAGSFRCECCGERLLLGDEVAVFDGWRVVAHWGPCPSPATWFIDYSEGGRARRMIGDARPFEDAYAEAVELRAMSGIQHVWLTRFARAGRCSELVERPVPNGVECTYRKEPCGRAVVVGDRCDRHAEGDNA